MSSLSSEEVDALIANGRRLIQEAKDAMARSRQLFAEHNIDPREALEFVRRHGGKPAIQAVEAKVKAEIAMIQEEMTGRQVHRPKIRAAGQRPRMRSNMI